MNPIDAAIALLVLLGAALGAQRGVLRQVAVMAAFYASLVLAARHYGEMARLVVDSLPRADYAVASAYTLLGITAVGTLALVWLSHQVYQSTALPGLQIVDRVAGATLGLLWSWALAAFALTVLVYGLSVPWGAQEPLRREVGAMMMRSQLVDAARVSWPRLSDSLHQWLPGGLPAPLTP